MTKLRQAIGAMGEVRLPEQAEEPILAPAVRVALRQWLTEIRLADDLEKVGVKPRNTALFYGPPGTGKTTLAHHLSARLGIPMVLVGADGLVDKYVGESAKNISRLFNAMREAGAPALLFLDEIDAIGFSRDSAGDGAAAAEHKMMLTTLLRKVEETRCLMVAATNRKDALDQALWRRFHLQIAVELPSPTEAWAILKRYSLPYELDDSAIDLLTDLTTGASPALLRGLMEGMKRALVVNPKLGLAVDNAAKVFLPIITSLTPPPGIVPPPLWENGNAVLALETVPWPPELPEQAA